MAVTVVVILIILAKRKHKELMTAYPSERRGLAGFAASDTIPTTVQFGIESVYFGSIISDEAEHKAYDLMKEWLTPHQLEEYQAEGFFHVKGNFTGRTYRINPASRYFNVTTPSTQNEGLIYYCFVPDCSLPTGDKMLAQKIMLETDEQRVLEIANARDTPYL